MNRGKNMERSKPGDAARTYWHEVLTAGGRTAIPRWSAAPAKGVATHEIPLPKGLLTTAGGTAEHSTAADGTAAGSAAADGAIALLAAHARVLAALSGESEVTTGLPADGRLLPCRLTAAPQDTWRALREHTRRATAGLLTHAGFPVAALRHELGLEEPPFETVL